MPSRREERDGCGEIYHVGEPETVIILWTFVFLTFSRRIVRCIVGKRTEGIFHSANDHIKALGSYYDSGDVFVAFLTIILLPCIAFHVRQHLFSTLEPTAATHLYTEKLAVSHVSAAMILCYITTGRSYAYTQSKTMSNISYSRQCFTSVVKVIIIIHVGT